MKNIRTTYLVIILLLSIFIFVIVLTDLNSHLEYSENDITLVDEIKINNENHLNKEKMKIYLLDKEDNIKTFETYVSKENIEKDIFSIYNEKMNSYNNLFSPMIFFQENVIIEKNNNKLTIELDYLNNLVDIDTLATCLLLTYNQIGIDYLTLKVGKTSIDFTYDGLIYQ